jgi:hypothetical protein
MLAEGQLIRELKLGWVNHDRVREWIKTVYKPESHMSQGDPVRHKGRQILPKDHLQNLTSSKTGIF